MASGVSGLRGRYLVRAFRVRGPHAAVRRGQTGASHPVVCRSASHRERLPPAAGLGLLGHPRPVSAEIRFPLRGCEPASEEQDAGGSGWRCPARPGSGRAECPLCAVTLAPHRTGDFLTAAAPRVLPTQPQAHEKGKGRGGASGATRRSRVHVGRRSQGGQRPGERLTSEQRCRGGVSAPRRVGQAEGRGGPAPRVAGGQDRPWLGRPCCSAPGSGQLAAGRESVLVAARQQVRAADR